MRITFCGVRGSTPAPGAEFVRTGGHTSCVAIAHEHGPPVLVLDAGTGLERCSDLFEGQAFLGTIVLTHLHWDHTHGLPFFPAGDRQDATVRVLVPSGDCAAPVELLARAMSPPSFPIRPEELRGRWTYGPLAAGDQIIEGFRVRAGEVPHSNSPTVGLRVESPTGASLAYLPDHAPHLLGLGAGGVGELHQAAMDLAAGVDVLVHDAQFTAEELRQRPHYGHSCADYAAELATAAGAKRLLLFHHEPRRTDSAVDCIVEAARQRWGLSIEAAREGMVIEL